MQRSRVSARKNQIPFGGTPNGEVTTPPPRHPLSSPHRPLKHPNKPPPLLQPNTNSHKPPLNAKLLRPIQFSIMSQKRKRARQRKTRSLITSEIVEERFRSDSGGECDGEETAVPPSPVFEETGFVVFGGDVFRVKDLFDYARAGTEKVADGFCVGVDDFDASVEISRVAFYEYGVLVEIAGFVRPPKCLF
ncbi:hypothetical protein PM082_008776 [Marasmius tenuissimus]|nr:hypothetical protein PM082_008776 [Marasmius tenuissimus]